MRATNDAVSMPARSEQQGYEWWRAINRHADNTTARTKDCFTFTWRRRPGGSLNFDSSTSDDYISLEFNVASTSANARRDFTQRSIEVSRLGHPAGLTLRRQGQSEHRLEIIGRPRVASGQERARRGHIWYHLRPSRELVGDSPHRKRVSGVVGLFGLVDTIGVPGTGIG